MRRKQIIFLKEFLVTQLNFWALFPVFLLLFLLPEIVETFVVAEMFPFFFLSLIPFYFYFVRICLTKLPLFLIFHLIAPAGVFYSPMHQGKMLPVCVITAVGFMIYSFYLRFHGNAWEDKKVSLPFAVGASVVAYFFLQYTGHQNFKLQLYYPLIAVIALSFAVHFMEHYLSFLLMNEESAGHIPAAEIFHSGMKLSGLYIALMSLFLLTTADVKWLKVFFDALGVVARYVAIFLIGLINDKPVESHVTDAHIPAGEAAQTFDFSGEAFWLWDYIGYTVVILFGIFLVIGLTKGLRGLLNLLKNGWKRSAPSVSDEVLAAAFDTHEKIAKKDTKSSEEKKKGSLFQFFTPSEQIRRLYKKDMLKTAVREDLEVWKLSKMTAKEYARRYAKDEAYLIYDKARYSQSGCNAGDVKEFKKYV